MASGRFYSYAFALSPPPQRPPGYPPLQMRRAYPLFYAGVYGLGSTHLHTLPHHNAFQGIHPCKCVGRSQKEDGGGGRRGILFPLLERRSRDARCSARAEAAARCRQTSKQRRHPGSAERSEAGSGIPPERGMSRSDRGLEREQRKIASAERLKEAAYAASFNLSAFSAIWSCSMHSKMSPSMKTGRLYMLQLMRWSVTRPCG